MQELSFSSRFESIVTSEHYYKTICDPPTTLPIAYNVQPQFKLNPSLIIIIVIHGITGKEGGTVVIAQRKLATRNFVGLHVKHTFYIVSTPFMPCNKPFLIALFNRVGSRGKFITRHFLSDYEPSARPPTLTCFT